MKLVLALSFLVFLFVAAPQSARAQAGPAPDDSKDLQIWTGGGHGLNGSNANTWVWTVGARYGWILTDPAGPGLLKGRFEYAVDVVPVFLVLQRTGTAYGFGLNPFALKWNFVPRHNVMPYIDIGGGIATPDDEKTPPGTSHVNFTTSGAIGAHFLRSKYNWSVELRFMHISNAGLIEPNPGINTLQVRVGFGRFYTAAPEIDDPGPSVKPWHFGRHPTTMQFIQIRAGLRPAEKSRC